MFNDVIVNMLELIETRIAQMRDRALELLNSASNFMSYVIEVAPSREFTRFIAVDSGFTEITYLGFRIAVINVALLMNVDGKGHVINRFDALLGISSEELERIALDMEAQYALEYSRSFPVDIVLLDGALMGRNYVNRFSTPLLAHVKDVKGDRYSQGIADDEFRNYVNRALQIMEEPLVMHMIMETYRARNRSINALVTKPYVVGRVGDKEVYGFYVQYLPETLPIYTEYVGDPGVIRQVVSRIAPLSTMPRLGYPAPLYIVDRIAKVNADFKGMVRLIMEKLGGEVLSELRGMYLKIGLNEYVKSK
ncbi:DNA double-strand break repair nuclease NurA [Vulcanisaeta distributa]|uniref:NurA domain protein n=1 Tax=Vulcanisaeta distributa (strain DSM 14429 / JCM 11212 / NBRC 100878 / IC-017) TaxID=572478 RepID=E1QQZ6_VULDI|nr:DNA double-strand break repair nuclease NurA [Vulcanisaeta distributa]ADN50566.1 NurA domain protein [Vulcanisaeta distributa DSM 14429]